MFDVNRVISPLVYSRVLLFASIVTGSAACVRSQTPVNATCPSGTVRVDDGTYSGGAEIGSGFFSVDVVAGTAAYRLEKQNTLSFQCAFVCPFGTHPSLFNDRVVCNVTSARTEVVSQ